jgi:hypothetical protein
LVYAIVNPELDRNQWCINLDLVLAGKVASDRTLVVQIRQLFSVLILCDNQEPLVSNTVVDAAQGTDIKGEDVVIVFERVDCYTEPCHGARGHIGSLIVSIRVVMGTRQRLTKC